MAGTDPSSSSSTSYIDYPALAAPTFTPHAHANALVRQTNDPADTPLDLATPLSRVLFDVQELDTHVDSLTTSHALPLVSHTEARSAASARVLQGVEEAVRGLEEGFARLQREVLERYAGAEEVRVAAERMVRTLRLGRAVQRAVALGRQVEGQMEGGGGWRGMVGAAGTVVTLRGLLAGEEGEGLGRVKVVGTLRQEVLGPAERALLARAQQVVREFSMSGLLAGGGGGSQQQQQQTFAQTEETKGQATSALHTLYLLSPSKPSTTPATFDPTLLLQALQSYLHTALTASVAALARALATLPTLDRTLLEISARCQNVVALEALLAGIKPPPHPLFPTTTDDPPPNFLLPLLRHLDTASLPSYFWRSLAGQMSSRVQEILARGGVSARTLRTNRERVREAIRECVDRGTRLPVAAGGREGATVGNWEREAAVMVGSVVGVLGR